MLNVMSRWKGGFEDVQRTTRPKLIASGEIYEIPPFVKSDPISVSGFPKLFSYCVLADLAIDYAVVAVRVCQHCTQLELIFQQ